VVVYLTKIRPDTCTHSLLAIDNLT